MNNRQAQASLLNAASDREIPNTRTLPICRFLENCVGTTHLLLIFLTVTSSTACLRLIPSERLENDASPTSDTPYLDTSSPADPCDALTCLNRPDAGGCANGILTIVSGDAYCVVDTDSEAKCRFDTEQVPCPDGACTDTKHCKDSTCHGVRCDNPPPNKCLDAGIEDSDGTGGAKLVVYEREGHCEPSGPGNKPNCVYDTARTIDCKGRCVPNSHTGAHCEDEPCAGMFCNRPPARYCLDANRLVAWNLYGRCTDEGSCIYDKRLVDCATKGGCRNGRCAEIPCEGMLCYRPPARYCSSLESAIDFDPLGTCDAKGSCVYREIQRPCPETDCTGGNCGAKACLEKSECHTPPAPYCNKSRQLVFWDAQSDCIDGRCTYNIGTICPAEGEEGPGDCENGRCKSDLCAGPSWLCLSGKPAAYCADGGVAVTSEWPACKATNPSCEYTTQNSPCPNGCHAGECLESSSALPSSGAAQ